MKFFKEKFDQFGKPLLLWFFSYKIFQSWANPEKQSTLTKFLIDDVFFKIFMYLIWAYATFILFIVYSIPTPAYIEPLVEGYFSIVQQLLPLEFRARLLRNFLFYVPGPYDLLNLALNTIDFLRDLVLIFSSLLTLPLSFQKAILLDLLDYWTGPTLEPFWFKLYDYLGFNSKIEENSHNFFTWLLLKKAMGKSVGLSKHPFYPTLLIKFNQLKSSRLKRRRDSLPPLMRLLYEIEDIRSETSPSKYFSFFYTEFYSGFWLWTKGDVDPQRDFAYLFNQNRYLMVRFITFSSSYDTKTFGDSALTEILHNFYISNSYGDDIKKDSNWSTMRWSNHSKDE
jgi:hypothetical protein